NKPHHAKSPKTFRSSKKIVCLRRAGEKISEKGALASGCAACCFHISDSGTFFLIHNVTSAGNRPTKKTTRQLECRRSKTTHVVTAAPATPQAQALCTRAIARARRFVGQVSATSVAPVFHSPPIPSPRIKRKKIKTAKVVERPDPREQTE